jgi:hypothetical protein
MARRRTKLKKAAQVIDQAVRRENGAAERELRARQGAFEAQRY